jgi:hypothetical protein
LYRSGNRIERMPEAKIHEQGQTRTPSKTVLPFLRARRDAAPSSVVPGVIGVGCDAEGRVLPPPEWHNQMSGIKNQNSFEFLWLSPRLQSEI